MTLDEIFKSEDMLYVDKNIAKEIGLNAAIVLTGIENAIEKEGTSVFDVRYMQENYFPFFSISTISRSIKKLQNKGYLKQNKISSEKIKEIVLKEKKEPKYVCEWCGRGCNVLNEHHYPIPKSDGGTEIVKICPNCHYEFHSVECRLKFN